jgi:enterochelin esterase-like enzyme
MQLYNREQMNFFSTAVQQSARIDRQIKQQNERRKMEELKMRFSINAKKREENRKMIDHVKQSFHQANHQLYEQIRTKRARN